MIVLSSDVSLQSSVMLTENGTAVLAGMDFNQAILSRSTIATAFRVLHLTFDCCTCIA